MGIISRSKTKNNMINLLALRAEKWIYMGKWTCEILAIYFLKDKKVPDDRTFSKWAFYWTSGIKGIIKKPSQVAKKKINTVSKIFNFRENDYNLAKNTKFLAKSNFNSSANFYLLMTNDAVLESWHQGEFVLGLPAGFRGTYKNKLLVQSKQTVEKIDLAKSWCFQPNHSFLQKLKNSQTILIAPF